MKKFISAIVFLLVVNATASDRWVVEFKSAPSYSNLKKLRLNKFILKAGFFTPYKSDYFSRLVEIETEKITINELKQEIEKSSPIVQLEKVGNAKIFGLRLGNRPKQSDTLSVYQWSIKNLGQTILRDITDIRFKEVRGSNDIGLNNKVKDIIKKNLKRAARIAVIDSGMDLEHTDIQGALLKNEEECVKGQVLPQMEKDQDGNGYKGDCLGWNFDSKEEGGDNRPYDDTGHGTHVGGIIGAVGENNQGIFGFGNFIKVLPIRVTGGNEARDEIHKNGVFTDRVAKAILYAVERDVDIINLSLGWPKLLDSQFLRKSFQVAKEKGILIVAAAGNNSSVQPIFPCAYEEVICVGASSIDGEIAHFSNFGMHVDVLAPGEEILSLFPFKLDPQFFSVEGYDLKNGTSQSAPLVAAALGILKGIKPHMDLKELRGEFLSSLLPLSKNLSLINGGSLNLSTLLVENSKKISIRPSFKGINTLSVDSNGVGHYTLKIENLNPSKKEFSVVLTGSAENKILYSFKRKYQISGFGKIEIPLSVKNLTELETENFSLKVETYIDSQNLNYSYNLPVTYIMSKAMAQNRFQLNQSLNDMDLKSELKTVTDLDKSKNTPDYYFQIKNNNGINLNLLKLDNSLYDSNLSVDVLNATRILGIYKKDFNLDGTKDYMIFSVIRIEKDVFLQMDFLDKDLKPLFGPLSKWKYIPEKVVLGVSKASWVNYSHPLLGLVSLPLFQDVGEIPEKDKNPSVWEKEDTSAQDRLFYLEPSIDQGQVILKTRLFNNWKFIKNVEKLLDVSWKERIHFKALLQDQNKALMWVQGINSETPFIVSINDQLGWEVENLSTSASVLRSIVEPWINLKTGKFESVNLYRQYSPHRLSWIDLNDDKIRGSYNHPESPDYILGAMSFFRNDRVDYGFYQSKKNLLLHKIDRNQNTSILDFRPINRFTFLPGKVFKEIFHPVVVGEDENVRPGLYVDARQMNFKQIYVIDVFEDKMRVNPRNSLIVPDNCEALNPGTFPNSNGLSFVFICKEDQSWEIQTLEMR